MSVPLSSTVKTVTSDRAIDAVQPRRAGFWVRCAAGLIDLTILAIPFCVFVSFLSVGMGISNAFVDLNPYMPPRELLLRFGSTFLFFCLAFFLVMEWLYFAFLESSRWRATPGKRLLGIYVADENGKPVSFWRSSRRFLGGRLLIHVPYVGIYYFLADCMCVGIFPAKRAIHDWLAGCVVTREGLGSPVSVAAERIAKRQG
jgi:uncharacterized RDD family membrane protein YckC